MVGLLDRALPEALGVLLIGANSSALFFLINIFPLISLKLRGLLEMLDAVRNSFCLLLLSAGLESSTSGNEISSGKK